MTYKIARNIIDVSHKYEVYIVIKDYNLGIDFYSEILCQKFDRTIFRGDCCLICRKSIYYYSNNTFKLLLHALTKFSSFSIYIFWFYLI